LLLAKSRRRFWTRRGLRARDNCNHFSSQQSTRDVTFVSPFTILIEFFPSFQSSCKNKTTGRSEEEGRKILTKILLIFSVNKNIKTVRQKNLPDGLSFQKRKILGQF
jgi:hypothetical protein